MNISKVKLNIQGEVVGPYDVLANGSIELDGEALTPKLLNRLGVKIIEIPNKVVTYVGGFSCKSEPDGFSAKGKRTYSLLSYKFTPFIGQRVKVTVEKKASKISYKVQDALKLQDFYGLTDENIESMEQKGYVITPEEPLTFEASVEPSGASYDDSGKIIHEHRLVDPGRITLEPLEEV